MVKCFERRIVGFCEGWIYQNRDAYFVGYQSLGQESKYLP
jgi:hypothetical protein